MGSFTINRVAYGNTPSGSETMTFKYKRWDQPDSALITISSSAVVNTDGTLAVPLTVGSLTSGQAYYIYQTNNCASPAVTFIETVQIP